MLFLGLSYALIVIITDDCEQVCGRYKMSLFIIRLITNLDFVVHCLFM